MSDILHLESIVHFRVQCFPCGAVRDLPASVSRHVCQRYSSYKTKSPSHHRNDNTGRTLHHHYFLKPSETVTFTLFHHSFITTLPQVYSSCQLSFINTVNTSCPLQLCFTGRAHRVTGERDRLAARPADATELVWDLQGDAPLPEVGDQVADQVALSEHDVVHHPCDYG